MVVCPLVDAAGVAISTCGAVLAWGPSFGTSGGTFTVQ